MKKNGFDTRKKKIEIVLMIFLAKSWHFFSSLVSFSFSFVCLFFDEVRRCMNLLMFVT